MRKNNILEIVLTVITGICAILAILLVTKEQVKVFKYYLYVRQSFISVDDVITKFLIIKLIFSVALFVLGICNVYLYIFSFERTVFLQYSRLFMLAAGVISTIWETQTLFYAKRWVSLVWIKGGDAFTILYTICAINILIKQLRIKQKDIYGYFVSLIGIFFVALATVTPPVNAVDILKYFYYFIMLCTLFIIVCVFSKREVITDFYIVFFSGALCIFTFLIAWYKLDVTAFYHLFYQNYYPLCLSVYSILLFLFGFFRYRKGVVYNKEINRKIHEVNKFKSEVSTILIRHCLQPLNVIAGLNELIQSEKAGEINDRQSHLLKNIACELKKLKLSMNDIRDYTLFRGNSIKPSKMMIDIHIILKQALLSFHNSEELVCSFDEASNGYIYGDPYELIQANQILISHLLMYKAGNTISVSTGTADDEIKVSYSITADYEKRLRIRRMQKILKKRQIIQSALYDDDIQLAILKNILLFHDAEVSTSLNSRDLFVVSYSLPLCPKTDQSLEYENYDGSSLPAVNKRYKKIVLISEEPAQIEIIKSYLEAEPYTLVIFSIVAAAIKYISEEQNIGLVIIGTTFVGLSNDEICRKIGKTYSLGQLPRLLIRREKNVNLSDSLLQEVNDILTEPYEKGELLLKIRLLMALQESVEGELKARLDFLQVQMNPHFIFNSISMIMPLCIEQPEKAYHLLGNFSDYLRRSLYSGELQRLVPIHREIDLVTSYLELEKARFGDRILYTISIECDEECLILPLMIEPIVENSVKHGKNKEAEYLKIELIIQQEEEWLYIQIRDNGVGISEKKLKEIIEMNSTHSIGLSNLKKRLMVYYKEKLEISSILGEGTVVSFKIPCRHGGEV